MDNYLQFCHSNLSNLNHFKQIVLVVGNESCDLDSAVCALVYGYIKHHLKRREEKEEGQSLTSSNDDDSTTPPSSTTTTSPQTIVLPILNVSRDDLTLRREIVFWFEQVLQFNLTKLICKDEVDFAKLAQLSDASITITLVDHNENKELARLLPNATFDEIIDHHKQNYGEEACPVADAKSVQIDTGVGSCSTLVALRFLDCSLPSQFDESHQPVNQDSQIALLLYGAILLDTICFSPTAKRFNATDHEAVNQLEDLLKHSAEAEASLFDRNEVYQRLVDAKNSLEGMSFHDLLRKDMKIVESLTDNKMAICMSSITGTLLTELSLRDKIRDLKSYCDHPPATVTFSDPNRPRVFNAIVLMSLDDRIANNLRRQLALYCTNKILMKTIATCLERSEIEVELITASDSLRIYNQNNLTASRKVVLPIIFTLLNGRANQTKDGLNRQPSIRRKIPVNHTLMSTSYDKDDQEPSSPPVFTDPLRSNNHDSNHQSQSAIPNGKPNSSTSPATSSHVVLPTNSNDDRDGTNDADPENGGNFHEIDMKVIEPYKKVISHGGYIHSSPEGHNDAQGSTIAIIIFNACYLPDRARKDYNYVMEHLFTYVLATLHNMIADDYILIYLHNGGGTSGSSENNMPTFGWLKRCYQLMDRKVKKNLKGLYLVHPTFWLKTLIIMSKPFISWKFSRKLKFVSSLDELRSILPIEHIAIPEAVRIYDKLRNPT